MSKGAVQKKPKPAAAYAMVADALKKAPWLPGSRDNFLASVASSLGVHKDERHKDQQVMVDMIGAGIEECRAEIQAKVDEAKAQVDHAQSTEKDNRDKALDAAKMALAVLEEEVEAKSKALADATTEEGDKKKLLHEKNENQKSGDKMFNAINDMKVKLGVIEAAFGAAGTTRISPLGMS